MKSKNKNIFLSIIATVLVLFGIIAIPFMSKKLTEPFATPTISKLGSKGNEVKEIQKRLKNWGYYNGSIDGKYGEETKSAVSYFQRKNGLTADGIAGNATLRAMGIIGSAKPTDFSDDVSLLARIISSEARGESYIGQVAVGAVVLNRVEHPSFPNSISGVVFQPGAFTAVNDGQITVPTAESSVRAAKDALDGVDPTGGAVYYYNPDKTSNKWIRTRPIITRIGNHLFCS